MQMLYNSDSYVVVQIDLASETSVDAPGGYEIVDKFAKREIFLQGVMAEHFKVGVEALIQSQPSEEEVDAYIERYASLMQQPVILH